MERNHHRELKTSLAASIIFRQTKFNYPETVLRIPSTITVYLILTAMLYPETLLRIPSSVSKPKSREFKTEVVERTGGQSGGVAKKIRNFSFLALRYCSSSELNHEKLKDASKCRKPSVNSNKR